MRTWFDSELGQYVLAREQAWFDAVSADLFGFNAMQMGHCGVECLRDNRMPHRFCGSPEPAACRALGVDSENRPRRADFLSRSCPNSQPHGGSLGQEAGGKGAVAVGLQPMLPKSDRLLSDLICQPEHLPIASQSLDLLALPHQLEFSAQPHQVLREAERVLRPEGRLLISGFNPLSLWGLRRSLNRHSSEWPWRGRFIHLTRLKDWLALLGFELAGGRMACYAPPMEHGAWIDRFAFLEAAGDRWWALGGGVYLIHAVKRVHGMRLIAPKWEGQWLPRPNWASTTRNSLNNHG